MGKWPSCFLLILLFPLAFTIPSSNGLQSYQAQLLLQLRKHLEYPPQLEVLENYNGDLCNLSPSSSHLSISCQNDSITELKIMGDKLAKVSEFGGFSVPNQTLSSTFSIDSFVTTLARLATLKVVCLVSLGMWGELPDKIHRLSSLELLDLSSNFLFGVVPPDLSRMVKLNSLTLDGNYFNGSVPDWLDSFSNLTILSLKSNRFEGQFPPSITRISTLTGLALSHNQLSGSLPGLSTLTSLHMLDLRENKLDSELPVLPKGLVTVLLSNNSFSGEVPEEYGHLSQLQHLDLSTNHLTGTPPASLFSLPNISYLNLASNSLSGSLSGHLTCGSRLGYVDISRNKLTGGLPSCLTSASSKRGVKFEWNCLLTDAQNQHSTGYCEDEHTGRRKPRGRAVGILAAVVGGAVLVIGILAFGLIYLCRRCHSKNKKEHNIYTKAVQESAPSIASNDILANARFISQAAKLGTQGTPACRVFSLEELKEATNNFELSAFMGEGSIGKVYKGRLENGTYVAIRSLSLMKRQSIQNLKVRLDLLAKLHHPHLVTLMGHCIHGDDDSTGKKVYLVHEFVPGGNYRARLAETSPEEVLKWSDRLRVLIGIAKAVHFLHSGVVPGTISNQLKTNNILLDEHWIAKLSGYGMPIITEEIEKLEAKGDGTKSGQRMNFDDDVYKFGFILLESLVGPIETGKGEAFLLNEMASFGSQDGRRRIVDPAVLTTCSQESLSIAVSLTSKCILPDPSKRPSFEDVLWNLQYAAQVQATADADQKSDSTA